MKSACAVSAEESREPGLSSVDFESLMAREQKRIYLLCLRLLKSRDEADSAVQDVFVKAYRALDRSQQSIIRDPDKWLTRVAVNTCMDVLRSRRFKFWHGMSSADAEQTLLSFQPSAGLNQEEIVIQREKMQRLNQSLKKLSLRQRVVFLLRHEEGKRLEEIAEILGVDLGTVKAHMARAVARLREELRDLYVR